METDEELFHAIPQVRGRIEHESVDKKTSSTRKNDLMNMPIFSQTYRLVGKIDIYKGDQQHLIEKKYLLRNIYQGQVYQLWAQMLCLEEMGYSVKKLSFYEISTNKSIQVELPTETDIRRFSEFIEKYHQYSPDDSIDVNVNKCQHCIYCNLCDKTSVDNVYQ